MILNITNKIVLTMRSASFLPYYHSEAPNIKIHLQEAQRLERVPLLP